MTLESKANRNTVVDYGTTDAVIRVLYFSPTGNTLRMLRVLVETLPPHPVEWYPYNTPANRASMPIFRDNDILIWGSPVYAGKLPNKLLPWLHDCLHGYGNPAVLLCTFGNRGFDNALAEMQSLALTGGFRPMAAAAMVAKHAFDGSIGKGRPTKVDLTELRQWASRIRLDSTTPLRLPGNAKAPYYQPLRQDLQPATFLKAAPQFDDNRCDGCGVCVDLCPMGSLVMSDTGHPVCQDVCIKCMACVQGCPQQAVDILHPDFLSHIHMLHQHCQSMQPNAFYC